MILLIIFTIFLLGCILKWMYEGWKEKQNYDETDNDDWKYDEEEEQ